MANRAGKKSRETLRNYFRNGARPTENEFGDLIDSTLNLADDGFDRSDEHGFEVTPAEKRRSLISFFERGRPQNPAWQIRFDETADTLAIERPAEGTGDGGGEEPTDGMEGAGAGSALADPAARSAFSLHPHGLDVGGIIRYSGRLGIVPETRGAPLEAYADQKWHAITPELSGCRVLEVVAGVGVGGTGHYALLHAIALCTHAPPSLLSRIRYFGSRRWPNRVRSRRSSIRVTHAHYGTRLDKLRLRWSRTESGYVLEISSRRPYQPRKGASSVPIRYHVSELWADHSIGAEESPTPGKAMERAKPDVEPSQLTSGDSPSSGPQA